MQTFGCIEQSSQTQHSRVQAPSSPEPESGREDPDDMSEDVSFSEHQDPDFEPGGQPEDDGSDSETDSNIDFTGGMDSSNDERPIPDEIDPTNSDADTDDVTHFDEHDFCVQGSI